MNTTVSVLLDKVASATKAVSMIRRDGNVEVSVSTATERVVLPAELTWIISQVISAYVDEKKEIVAKVMAEESDD